MGHRLERSEEWEGGKGVSELMKGSVYGQIHCAELMVGARSATLTNGML